MAEITRDGARNMGTGGNIGTGGTGYNSGSGYSGSGGVGNSGDPLGPDRRGNGQRSNAAVWIVAIVVVVGALAIWIARNGNDDSDNMRSSPGMGVPNTDRNDGSTRSTADPYGNSPTQGSGAMDAQQGTGTITGDAQDPRIDGANTNDRTTPQEGADRPVGTTGTGTDTRGTGTSSEGVGTRPENNAGSSTTGSGTGPSSNGDRP